MLKEIEGWSGVGWMWRQPTNRRKRRPIPDRTHPRLRAVVLDLFDSHPRFFPYLASHRLFDALPGLHESGETAEEAFWPRFLASEEELILARVLYGHDHDRVGTRCDG